MGMSKETWCCTKCEREGPYCGDNFKYPKGWRFNLTHGLVCSQCAKKYKIKTSDVEREETNKEGETWEKL